jgi:hypothetical protein
LAIVVARRSWLETSLWKTENDRKKEKEHTRKKEKGAYEKEKDPNSRAQPPRSGDCAQVLAQLPSKEGNRGRFTGSSTY